MHNDPKYEHMGQHVYTFTVYGLWTKCGTIFHKIGSYSSPLCNSVIL